tara:strand:+ start:610 stop:741 length:132 start_codon:yes stop_codon:yes gene_type:complete
MNKILLSITLMLFLAGCATTDLLPKRKTCSGENKTLADLTCKK